MKEATERGVTQDNKNLLAKMLKFTLQCAENFI